MQDSSKSLIATSFGHLANDGLLSVFPILYPILLLHAYSFTATSIGVIGGALNLFSIVTSPFIGRRSDVGRNFVRLMIVGVAILSLGVAGFALALGYFHGTDLFLVLILFASLAGFGSSSYHPIGAAVLNEQWGRKNRGRALGINGSIGSVGTLGFPIIAVALIGAFGTSSVVLLSGAGFAIAALIYSLMRRVRFRSVPDASNDASMKSNLDLSQSSTPHSLGHMRESTVPLRIVIPPILALTIYSFIRSIFAQSVNQFLPIYLNSVNHVQYGYVALAASVVPAMGAISQPLVGQLADRYGRRLILAISSIGGFLAILLFIYSSNIFVGEVFLGILGMFQFTAFPLILGLSNEISSKGAKTFSSSIVWGLGVLGGGVVGPIIFGILTEPAFLGSLSSAFLAITFIGLVAVVFVPFIPKPIAVRG